MVQWLGFVTFTAMVRFNSWSGNWDPCKPHGAAKKQTNKKGKKKKIFVYISPQLQKRPSVSWLHYELSPSWPSDHVPVTSACCTSDPLPQQPCLSWLLHLCSALVCRAFLVLFTWSIPRAYPLPPSFWIRKKTVGNHSLTKISFGDPLTI